MLLDLFNCADDALFALAMEPVKRSYLSGEYTANGKAFALPFEKNYEEMFGQAAKASPEAAAVILDKSVVGHYNHFCNVNATMAHMLVYAEKHMDALLPKGEKGVERAFSNRRKLDNMFKAYYHDVGKTIISRRHAVEGSALFAEPKASVRFRFEGIFAQYDVGDADSRTLADYALNIGAHDLIGTISTGENGILSMCGVIERFKSLYNGDKVKVKTAVFDLWLLNVADIIVSINDFIPGESKWDAQDWQGTAPGNMDGFIEKLLNSYKGAYLLEDLAFALQIAGADDSYAVAKALAVKRAACRFQRLARQTLGDVLERRKSFPSGVKGEVIKYLDGEAIIPSVKAILRGEFGESCNEYFGTMLQFDYALGFFIKLAERAVRWLEEELIRGSFRTGWLYNQKVVNPSGYDAAFIDRYNAECIVNNFMMVLAGVFGEVHRLTADIERWNIEFDDAAKRLTDSKAEKLLYFDGAYRAGNARVLLMREIMLYKG